MLLGGGETPAAPATGGGGERVCPAAAPPSPAQAAAAAPPPDASLCGLATLWFARNAGDSRMPAEELFSMPLMGAEAEELARDLRWRGAMAPPPQRPPPSPARAPPLEELFEGAAEGAGLSLFGCDLGLQFGAEPSWLAPQAGAGGPSTFAGFLASAG